MFLKRSFAPEIMDDFSIQDERIDLALSELTLTNRLLGGISTSEAGLKILLNGGGREEISALDIGAGASDILQHLNKKLLPVKITSIDLNKRACKFLKANSISKVICANSLQIPVKENAFDIIHASLFLHHFNEEEIKELLTDLLKISRSGIIINDLRRSIFALLGIKIISTLFSKSEMFRNDGPLSVRRGFIKSDWVDILSRLNIKKYKLKRKWAFRWMLVIYAK